AVELGLHQLGLDPVLRERVGEQLGGGALFPRRVGGVDPEQRAEEIERLGFDVCGEPQAERASYDGRKSLRCQRSAMKYPPTTVSGPRVKYALPRRRLGATSTTKSRIPS